MRVLWIRQMHIKHICTCKNTPMSMMNSSLNMCVNLLCAILWYLIRPYRTAWLGLQKRYLLSLAFCCFTMTKQSYSMNIANNWVNFKLHYIFFKAQSLWRFKWLCHLLHKYFMRGNTFMIFFMLILQLILCIPHWYTIQYCIFNIKKDRVLVKTGNSSVSFVSQRAGTSDVWLRTETVCKDKKKKLTN